MAALQLGAAGGCCWRVLQAGARSFSLFNDAAVLTVISHSNVLRLSRPPQDTDAVAQAIQSVEALLAAEAERIAAFANMNKENMDLTHQLKTSRLQEAEARAGQAAAEARAAAEEERAAGLQRKVDQLVAELAHARQLNIDQFIRSQASHVAALVAKNAELAAANAAKTLHATVLRDMEMELARVNAAKAELQEQLASMQARHRTAEQDAEALGRAALLPVQAQSPSAALARDGPSHKRRPSPGAENSGPEGGMEEDRPGTTAPLPKRSRRHQVSSPADGIGSSAQGGAGGANASPTAAHGAAGGAGAEPVAAHSGAGSADAEPAGAQGVAAATDDLPEGIRVAPSSGETRTPRQQQALLSAVEAAKAAKGDRRALSAHFRSAVRVVKNRGAGLKHHHVWQDVYGGAVATKEDMLKDIEAAGFPMAASTVYTRFIQRG
ncbi:hypothetical protein ABPG77_008863 [Micractinium sp. CCAP 211/92]